LASGTDSVRLISEKVTCVFGLLRNTDWHISSL